MVGKGLRQVQDPQDQFVAKKLLPAFNPLNAEPVFVLLRYKHQCMSMDPFPVGVKSEH